MTNSLSVNENDPAFCGGTTTTLTVYRNNEVQDVTPDWIYVSDTQIEVFTRETANAGQYRFTLTHTLNQFPTVTLTEELLEVYVFDMCTTTSLQITNLSVFDYSSVTETDYLIGTSETLRVVNPTVSDEYSISQQTAGTVTTDVCGTISRQLVVTRGQERLETADIPAWIVEGDLAITFAPTTTEDSGYYSIYYSYQLDSYAEIDPISVNLMHVWVYDPCEVNNFIYVDSTSTAVTGSAADSYYHTFYLQSSAAIYKTIPTAYDSYGVSFYVQADQSTWNRCGPISQQIIVYRGED